MAPSQNNLKDWTFEESKATSTMTILTPEAERRSNLFKESSIYPQILRGWRENNSALVNDWLSDSNIRFEVSDTTKATFEAELAQLAEEKKLWKARKTEMESSRILHTIEEWSLLCRSEPASSSVTGEASGSAGPPGKVFYPYETVGKDRLNTKDRRQDRDRRDPGDHTNGKKIFAQDLLPNGTTSAIVRHFRLEPSPQLIRAMRAVAFLMAKGEFNNTDSPQQIMDVVSQKGGYDWLLKQPVHHLIV
jgi:hypothetical protein